MFNNSEINIKQVGLNDFSKQSADRSYTMPSQSAFRVKPVHHTFVILVLPSVIYIFAKTKLYDYKIQPVGLWYLRK